MTENLMIESRMKITPNRRSAQTQLGAPPERILREIAFVLKMTQRVRDEIEVERDEQALAAV